MKIILSILLFLLMALSAALNIAWSAPENMHEKTDHFEKSSRAKNIEISRIVPDGYVSHYNEHVKNIEDGLEKVIRNEVEDESRLKYTYLKRKELVNEAYELLVGDQKGYTEQIFAEEAALQENQAGLYLIGAYEYLKSPTEGVAIVTLISKTREWMEIGIDQETAFKYAKAEVLQSVEEVRDKSLKIEYFEEFIKAIKNCAREKLGLKPK